MHFEKVDFHISMQYGWDFKVRPLKSAVDNISVETNDLLVICVEAKKKTKFRNRFNRLLYLTQDSIGENDKKTQKKTSPTRDPRDQLFSSR